MAGFSGLARVCLRERANPQEVVVYAERCRLAAWVVWLTLAFPLGLPAANVALDASSPNPMAILSRAFANQYEVDISSNIELRMKNGSGQERTRRFEALQKITGVGHSRPRGQRARMVDV